MSAGRPLRIAYFSPLPPSRSGIARYSLLLLEGLVSRSPALDIDLWVEGGEVAPEVAALGLRCIGFAGAGEAFDRLDRYDVVVYQMGNNVEYHGAIYDVALRHPGLVVLHDYVLHHMLARLLLDLRKDREAYVEEMAFAHGPAGERLARDVVARRAKRPWETPAVVDQPLNARLVRASRAVLVHSGFAEERLRRDHPGLTLRLAGLPVATPSLEGREARRQALGLGPETFLVGSFGFATRPKRLTSLLRALSELAESQPVHGAIVGELLDPEIAPLMRRLDLEPRVHRTGYVSPEQFGEYVAACDACVNLRHPTCGEASASVCEILAAGRPCAVSDVGWFADLPDDAVRKIPVGEDEVPALVACLREWAADPDARAALGARGRRYVEEHHSVSALVDAYLALFEEVAALGPGDPGRPTARTRPLRA